MKIGKSCCMKRVSFTSARASKKVGIFPTTNEKACFMLSLTELADVGHSRDEFDALLPGGSDENIAIICCMAEIG